MMRNQDVTDKHAKLMVWLKSRLPEASNFSIGSLERASSGFSNETHVCDLRWRENGGEKMEKVIIRWPPENFLVFPEDDVLFQYRVMKCLEDSGVPVPKVHWAEEDPSVLGSPFFVMERIEGTVPPDTAPGYHGCGLFYEATPERRTNMWWRSIEAMAQVHSLDWETLGLSFLGVPEDGADSLDRQMDFWERMMRWAAREPLPVLEAGFEWVKKNRFDPSRVCLCWGDARPGNIIYRDDEVASVLDWELAYLGPPESDLAYFLFTDWSFADTYGIPRLEGVPSMEETIRYYEGITGRRVENLFYHEVFQSLKLAVIIVLVNRAVTEVGMPGFPPDFATNNWPTHKLAELLCL